MERPHNWEDISQEQSLGEAGGDEFSLELALRLVGPKMETANSIGISRS